MKREIVDMTDVLDAFWTASERATNKEVFMAVWLFLMTRMVGNDDMKEAIRLAYVISNNRIEFIPVDEKEDATIN